MRGAINASTIFGTIVMARQGSSSLILVIEGDDDHFLIDSHVNDGDVILIGGNGRPKLLEAAEKAERRGIRGVRFLVDVDYDRFARPTDQFPANVIASKHHDAVMDLIMANIGLLDRVIDSHSRSARRRGVQFDTPAAREAAFELAATVAPLRIVNERAGHNLTLKKFPFGDLPSISPTAIELAQAAIKRSATTVTDVDLAAQITAEHSHLGLDKAVLVGDHDLFRALSRVLREYGVTAVADSMWTAFLPGVMCAELAGTDWYREVEAWGAANARTTFTCPCAA